MNDTQITLQGWLGGSVTSRQAGGSPVATFRVASTPRRFSRKSEQWVDGETQWYTVTAWRSLADNCARSLDRGDPVVVHGRLAARSYVNGNGVEVVDLEVEATFVGHDLNRGTTTFAKTPRPEALRVVSPDGDQQPDPAPSPAATAAAPVAAAG